MATSNIQHGSQYQEIEIARSPSQSPSDPNMEREYEFFVTTEEPHQPEGPERGLIRRLVMRNFFETKWAGPSLNASEVNSASTVQAKRTLKSRFRLPKPGQERETKAKSRGKRDRKEDEKRSQQREKRPKPRRVASAESDGGIVSAALDGSKSWTNCRKPSPAGDEDSNVPGAGKSKKLLLKINPSAHRFDPFDVLPVPGTPQMDTLFKLYKRGSRANSIAINARNTWWSFISNDAGLLHATLATWALYGMIVRGMNCLRVEMLRHKNESIKEINTKIGQPQKKISDELVGTVLTLASFENLLGAYDAAQLHIAALKRMVNARGGLFAFGHNDGLIKGIIWVDFHTAAAFHTPPSFPQIPINIETPALPDALLEEAAYTSPTSLLQFSLAAIDCFNIFYRLHRLALAVSSQWIGKADRLTVSNLLYETEYIILSVPDYSRDFLDFDLEKKDESDEDYAERATTADAASVLEGLLAGAQLFVYAALREVPPRAKLFKILLDRLRVAIDRPDVRVIEKWKREKNLNMLLWVLVVASSLATTWGESSWWMIKLAEVVEELNIDNQADLEKALKGVAWTDIFSGTVMPGIWEEVAQYKLHMARSRLDMVKDNDMVGIENGLEEIVDPYLLERQEEQPTTYSMCMGWECGYGEKGFTAPMEFDSGRWKVNGWYI